MTVTWNPSDIGSNVSLSAGNLTITSTTSGGAVGACRATTSQSSGKYYFEVHIDVRQSGGSTFYPTIGVMSGSDSLSTYVGSSSTGWSFRAQNGNKIHGGVSATYSSAAAAGTYIGVAVDFTAGSVEFFANGSSMGVAYSSGVTGTLYPAVALTGATTQDKLTANFGATAFNGTIPSGFSSWDGSQSSATTYSKTCAATNGSTYAFVRAMNPILGFTDSSSVGSTHVKVTPKSASVASTVAAAVVKALTYLRALSTSNGSVAILAKAIVRPLTVSAATARNQILALSKLTGVTGAVLSGLYFGQRYIKSLAFAEAYAAAIVAAKTRVFASGSGTGVRLRRLISPLPKLITQAAAAAKNWGLAFSRPLAGNTNSLMTKGKPLARFATAISIGFLRTIPARLLPVVSFSSLTQVNLLSPIKLVTSATSVALNRVALLVKPVLAYMTLTYSRLALVSGALNFYTQLSVQMASAGLVKNLLRTIALAGFSQSRFTRLINLIRAVTQTPTAIYSPYRGIPLVRTFTAGTAITLKRGLTKFVQLTCASGANAAAHLTRQWRVVAHTQVGLRRAFGRVAAVTRATAYGFHKMIPKTWLITRAVLAAGAAPARREKSLSIAGSTSARGNRGLQSPRYKVWAFTQPALKRGVSLVRRITESSATTIHRGVRWVKSISVSSSSLASKAWLFHWNKVIAVTGATAAHLATSAAHYGRLVYQHIEAFFAR